MLATGDGVRRLPVTADQRAVWFMDRYGAANGRLGLPVLLRIRGTLEREVLDGALADLLARHDALRTTYLWERRTLYHLVHPIGALAVRTEFGDLAGAAEPERLLDERITAFLRTDPPLDAAPLRAGLWRLADDDSLLIVNPHHIVSDAWANALLVRDLESCYRARAGLAEPVPPAGGWQFSDYAEWKLRDPRRERRPGASAQAAGGLAVNPFESERPRGGPARHVRFTLETPLVAALERVATERGGGGDRGLALLAPLFAALRTAEGPDPASAVGVTVNVILANRSHAELRETVGRVADMQPVRASLGAADGPGDVLDAVRDGYADAVSRAGEGGRTEERDVVFHLMAAAPTAFLPADGFAGAPAAEHPLPDGLGSRFGLQLQLSPVGDTVQAAVRYAADRCSTAEAEGLAAAYLAAAHALADPVRA